MNAPGDKVAAESDLRPSSSVRPAVPGLAGAADRIAPAQLARSGAQVGPRADGEVGHGLIGWRELESSSHGDRQAGDRQAEDILASAYGSTTVERLLDWR